MEKIADIESTEDDRRDLPVGESYISEFPKLTANSFKRVSNNTSFGVLNFIKRFVSYRIMLTAIMKLIKRELDSK